MEPEEGVLVKISSAGTISLPKKYRKYADMQKGDYVMVVMEGDNLVVKKAMITPKQTRPNMDDII